MEVSKIDNIPHFLRAKTPEALRKAMLRNNVKWGLIFDYYQIVFDGKNWFAWYQMNAVESMQDELKEMEARGTSGDR
jgi:hypothetical protein